MAKKPEAPATNNETAEDETEQSTAQEEEEEEEAPAGETAADDPDAEEEEVSEELFAAQPVLPAGTYEMELTKCAPRTAKSDEREGYRSGIEYTFEPDRSEFPDAPSVRDTVWAAFYDDDKPGFKDMNRRSVQHYRGASLFPEPVILTGKPGTAKKVKMDYDAPVGGMYKVKVSVEEFQGEKKNRVQAIKAI